MKGFLADLLFLHHQAIQRWRSARQQSRLARLQVQGEEEGTARRDAQALALQRQAEEERREAALRLEDWRERRRRQQEQEEERRRAEEVQQRRRVQEERRRQQEVKLALEAQLRERREEEEAQALRRAEEEQGEEEERRRTAGQEIRRFQERVCQQIMYLLAHQVQSNRSSFRYIMNSFKRRFYPK